MLKELYMDKENLKSEKLPFDLKNSIEYSIESIVSRTIYENKSGTITLFSFDEGQNLSEHTAPFDAFALIAEGQAKITIGGKSIEVKEGEMLMIPAEIPHAVKAEKRFKMLLSMFRE